MIYCIPIESKLSSVNKIVFRRRRRGRSMDKERNSEKIKGYKNQDLIKKLINLNKFISLDPKQ